MFGAPPTERFRQFVSGFSQQSAGPPLDGGHARQPCANTGRKLERQHDIIHAAARAFVAAALVALAGAAEAKEWTKVRIGVEAPIRRSARSRPTAAWSASTSISPMRCARR